MVLCCALVKTKRVLGDVYSEYDVGRAGRVGAGEYESFAGRQTSI